MKTPLFILLFAIMLCSFGCMTQPLTINEDGDRIAAPLEVESADIKFLNYCGYKLIPETQTENFKPIPGIIVVTDKELSIAPGNSRSIKSKETTKIPINEIEGIAQIGRQLQLRFKGRVLVAFIYGKYPFEIDYERDEELFNLLKSKGVPEFESTIAYNDRRRRGANDQWDEGPPTALESVASDNKQYPYTSQDGSVYNTGDTYRSTP